MREKARFMVEERREVNEKGRFLFRDMPQSKCGHVEPLDVVIAQKGRKKETLSFGGLRLELGEDELRHKLAPGLREMTIREAVEKIGHERR